MAARPNRYFRFAYSPAVGALVEPPNSVLSGGFATGQRPPAQWFNQQFNLMGGWIDYLRGPSLGNWTRRAWGLTSFDAAPFLAADTGTPEREIAPRRYLLAGNVAGAIKTYASVRGVEWADTSATIPGSMAAETVLGCVFIATQFGYPSDHWIVWTTNQLMTTSPDAVSGGGVSGISAAAPIVWNEDTLPGGYGPRALAFDANGILAAACDVAGVAGWMYSTNHGGTGGTWTAGAFTAGPPSGASGDIVWTGTRYVLVTVTGQVWRTSTVLSPMVLAATLAAGSTNWRLAVGSNGAGGTRVVAYETNVTTTRAFASDDDGATWTALSVPTDVDRLTRLAYVDGAWVATAKDAPYVWQTNDLKTWTRGVLPVPESGTLALDTFAYAEGAILAAGIGFTYQSGRAADAGPGNADGLTAPVVLSDAAYLRSRLVAATTPNDGSKLEYNATSLQWEPDATLRARVQTVDATQATLATVTPADGKATSLWVVVDARKTDGTQGASYVRRFAVRRTGGTVTAIGAVQTPVADLEDAAGWDVTVDISGTDVRVRVTGAAATTIDWTARITPGPAAP